MTRETDFLEKETLCSCYGGSMDFFNKMADGTQYANG
jgi:hypothetical protein